MDTDVIVVGAGAAGLAAARELAARSLRVVVFEGRDRIGGRVRWAHAGSVDAPVDLGAEFIHGDAPETSALLDEAGLACVATGDESWECRDGALLPAGDFDGGPLFERVGELAGDESVDVFLRRFDADPAMREQAAQARAFVEGFEAADPALASVRAIAEELRSGVDSTSSRPVGGYAPLFAYLAERCAREGIELRLDTTVVCIDWKPGEVTVTARGLNGSAIVARARSVIVTLPVGVLRHGDVTFAPPLPEATHTALAGLAMGHVVRVTLAFRTPFWETIAGGRFRDAAFFRDTGGAFAAFWTQVPLRRRTIVAWAGGPRAQALRGLSESDLVARALAAFGTMFGELERARDEFDGGAMHDWSADPFARGAYSYVVTGATGARAGLAAPVAQTIFFAGEATAADGQGGTVSGAFGTGVRAAREVLDARRG